MIAPTKPRKRRVHADRLPPPVEEWEIIEDFYPVTDLANDPVVCALTRLVQLEIEARKAVAHAP